MNKTLKVAKWEIKKNLKNKSFIISLFLTPVIFVVFFFLGTFMGETEDNVQIRLLVHDEIGVFPALEETAQLYDVNFDFEKTDLTLDEVKSILEEEKDTAYISITEEAMNEGVIPAYTSERIHYSFMAQVNLLAEPIKVAYLGQQGFTDEQLATINHAIFFEEVASDAIGEEAPEEMESFEDVIGEYIPGAFGIVLLFTIVFTGMMIFQSASQEKKDKIAEIILSSVTPTELMQGKVIGYFVLGIIQALVILAFAIPGIIYFLEIPVFKYLLVPETLLYIAIALLGYLLFSALFVGIGATIDDMSTTGNFQGTIMMLPFLSFLFIGPVLSNPEGFWAMFGTYFPFTTPGVLILRLMVLDEWPWIQLLLALVVLVASIWVFMKLAGKIFKVGILMYGKNATPKEIWRWIRA